MEDSPDSCSDIDIQSESEDYFSPDASSSDTSTADKPTLADDLYSFYISYNVPVAGMQFLLTALNKHCVSGVPPSLYKLRKTHKRIENDSEIQQIESGLYSYIGIKEHLSNYVSRRNMCDLHEVSVSMKVNIDGLPLYRSSSAAIWPIIISFENDLQPYPVALHFGKGKPSLDSYLSPFIDEVVELQNGIQVNDILVKISKVIFVCDAPARAHLQCIFGHTAKKGCSHCDAEGRYITDRIVFPSCTGNPREDGRYYRQEENNQIRLSPLTRIVGLKSSFPIDELHCVCLGVVRKMCHYLFSKKKKGSRSCRLKDHDVHSLSQDILQFRKCTPSEFQRQLRSIQTDLIHYKGTEFRSLLLYFGPFLFKKYLTKKAYDLLLLLHFAYYVFSSERFYEFYPQAHRCLEIFVNQFSTIFGEQSVSYNVHMLLHLHECVSEYGPLKNFSTFMFENFLGRLKRRIKVTRYTVSHVLRQMQNLQSLSSTASPHLRFSPRAPDNFAVIGDCIVKVCSVNGNIISGKALIFRDDLYTYPYNSKILGIGHYELSKRTISGEPNNKAIAFPVGEGFVILPLV